jgi:hypothetical protein
MLWCERTSTLLRIAAVLSVMSAHTQAQCPQCSISDAEQLNDPATPGQGADRAAQVTVHAELAIAVWESNDALGELGLGNDADILFRRSIDGGLSWSPPAPLNTNAFDDNEDANDTAPQLATDGDIWVAVWQSTAQNVAKADLGDDADILYACSIDAGQTWTAPAPLNVNAAIDSGDDVAPQLTTNTTGTWIAVWESTDDLGGTIGTDPDILFARYDGLQICDDAAVWTAPAALNDHAHDDMDSTDRAPQLATNSIETWIAVWQSNFDSGCSTQAAFDIRYARSTDAGMIWQPSALLNATTADCGEDRNPQLTWGPGPVGGVWIATWVSQENIDGIDADFDILFSRSVTNGGSWTNAAPLNSNAAIDASTFDTAPQLTTDLAGQWLAIWTSLPFVGSNDILISLSRDNGERWTPPGAFHSPAGDHPQIAAAGLGTWIAVWERFVGGDLDILTSRFEHAESPDCNANGLLDHCDIHFGFSNDCQGNCVPDECAVEVSGIVSASWVGGTGNWGDGSNWCPDLTPNSPNNGVVVVDDAEIETQYVVTIDDPMAVVSLNVSPTITSLELAPGATLQNDDSASVRTLATDQPILNGGILRATDGNRFVLDTPGICQQPECGANDGILEAQDSGDDNASILDVNGAVVMGGIARTVGTDSRIDLRSGTELADVTVSGVVVPDGEAGAFSGTILNDGLFRVADSGFALTFLAPAGVDNVLQGNGGGDDCLRLGGRDVARLGEVLGQFTNAANHRIDGAGVILGTVVNAGVIEANVAAPGEELILSAPGGKANSGVLRAVDGGVLRIADGVMQSWTGRIEAEEGGLILVTEDISGTGGMRAAGGTILFEDVDVSFAECIDEPPGFSGQHDSIVLLVNSHFQATTAGGTNDLALSSGVFLLSEGSTAEFLGRVHVCPDADHNCVLRVVDSVSKLAASRIQLCMGGEIDNHGGLEVSSLMTFDNTIESEWSWAPGSRLTMIDDALLEVGGRDFGVDPTNHTGAIEGFDNNFDLPELVIGPGADVALIDTQDNGNRIDIGFGDDEALYVHTLTFADPTSSLNLNGFHLYFEELIGDTGQIVDLPQDCVVDDDCDDGQFCNGAESCASGICYQQTEPCLGGLQTCDEANALCMIHIACPNGLIEECADQDGNGRRDDACVSWACNDGLCTETALPFGDAGGMFGACQADGLPSVHDRNHALRCFEAINTCVAMNHDVGGPFNDCQPDGACDIHDVNHTIDAFAGVTLCTCPSGPAPEYAGLVNQAQLRLQAVQSVITAGSTVDVHVFVEGALAGLRSYQLGLDVTGGGTGRLELIDINVHPLHTHVFAGHTQLFSASNVNARQCLAGLSDLGGAILARGGYLATYTYRASKRAQGKFVIDLDSRQANEPTVLVAEANREIRISRVVPAVVRVLDKDLVDELSITDSVSRGRLR